MNNDKSTNPVVSEGNVVDSTADSCFLFEAWKIVPSGAKFLRLFYKGRSVPVKNANDVLLWVCYKMSVYRLPQLKRIMRTQKVEWLNFVPGGMSKPYRVGHKLYINLDGSSKTALLRAAKVLDWLLWDRRDVSISYLNPPSEPQVQKPESAPEPHLASDEAKSKVESGHLRTFSYKFDNISSVTGTCPVTLFFKGDEYSLDGKWMNLPEKICIALEKMWPGKVNELVANGNVPYMATSALGLRRGQYVPEAKVWYEKNTASREFIRQTRSLCKLFGVDLSCVAVTYVLNGEQLPDDASTSTRHGLQASLNSSVASIKIEDVEKKLADIPDDEFVRAVVTGLLKQGRDGNETWDQCTSIPWCRHELGIRNALIHRLKIYESPSEYSQTYVALDQHEYSNYMILKRLDGFKRSAFMDWLQNLGFSIEEVCEVFNIEPPTYPAPVVTVSSATEVDVSSPPSSKSNSYSQSEESYVPDERSQMIKEYVEKHPGCAKQQAVDDLYAKGISKVLTRLERHPEVIDINDRLYVKETIALFEETADLLEHALSGLFDENGGYTSAHELYQTVQFDLDDFFYENDAFESEREVFDIAAYLFCKLGYKGHHYIFRGNMHIWRETPDYAMADCGLLIHWARLNGGVLTRQIGYDNLERRGAPETGRSAIFTLAMQKAKDKFWVLNSDEFLLKEDMDISAEFISDVKRQLDKLLALEETEDGLSFIPMGMIGDDFFDSLPPLPGNRPWSVQLLQAVIEDHCDALRYKTIVRSSYAGQSHAAVVPYGSEYQDFSDLVYAAIKAKNNKPSISYGRSQFIDFLKVTGLYPEDMAGSSIESMFSGNGHFKWIDKNNLVVS